MKSFVVALGLAATVVSVSAQADLALAKKSGCLACHSVEKKIVGPAWRDVGKKYKGDAAAKDRLVAKVKAGGKGVWGAAPMPPYSPRVSDENIEKLVTFVLSLGE
jgi:cytochrome c